MTKLKQWWLAVRSRYLEYKSDFWDPLDAGTKNRITAAYVAGESAACISLSAAAVQYYNGVHVDWRVTLGTAVLVGWRAAKSSLRQPHRKAYIKPESEQEGG